MDQSIVSIFPDETTAKRGAHALKEICAAGAATLAAISVVSKAPHGKAAVADVYRERTHCTAVGALTFALVGWAAGGPAAALIFAVVGEEILGRPALGDQAIENLDNLVAAQPLADLDGETFAAANVNDRKSPGLLCVAELVRDEAQTPGLIHTLRPAPCPAMDQHPAPLRLFAA